MCLGIPMQIVECEGDFAWADTGGGERRRINLFLLGSQEPGTRVLVNIDTAVRIIDEAEFELIRSALLGVVAAARGESTDAYFQDLIDRTPMLPPHLQVRPADKKGDV